MLDELLKRLITAGNLTVIDPEGRRRRYGGIDIPGVFPVTVRFHRKDAIRRLIVNPSLALGEVYMDGGLSVEQGDLYDFLALCIANVARLGRIGALTWTDHLRRFARFLLTFNPVSRSRRNVAHHYDLTREFYELFLDKDRQYSCAYFEKSSMSLDEAQLAKKRHMAAKLLLQPRQRVLDIGCGWGGLALSLARWADVRVTGVTLSAEQLIVARERGQEEGLAGRVSFELQDYRELEGRYDRIVSVGMFEHVGVPHYPEFFQKIGALLEEDGVAVIHSIGRADGPGMTNPWISKHIFPGGYIPALSEVLPAVEKAGLFVTDIEILRLHYAETLHEWRRRFLKNRDKALVHYDETFCRMWDFYLASCEASFRHDKMMVFQLQLAKTVDAVPLTRNYIAALEAAM